MNKLFAITISLCLFLNIHAQNRCGTMNHLHTLLQNDTALASRMQAIEQQTAQYVANPASYSQGSRAIITIPVVVHVVYNTAAQNISTAQIQSQIDRLNLDFHKLNTDWTNTPSAWQSLVADYQLQFCLASRDPNGNSTTGIVRTSTSTTSFIDDDKVKYTAQGGDNAWPAASYLNLWCCNLGGGLLGYAQFPGGAAATDGVVLGYDCFGSGGVTVAPYNLGRSATHEIGHWLNLYHIWGDDGSACTGSDNVNDTPNQGSEHYGCPNYPTVTCSNGPNGDMFMNYMDYTDDACMYMFTNGQYARSSSLFVSGGARYSLTTSLGCQALTSPPVANFSANVTQSCTSTINFTDASTGGATSWAWTFGDGGTSTTQSPTHTYAGNGTYTVALTVTNAYGTNTKTNTNYITISAPNAPTATGASRCGAGTLTLTSSASDSIKWFATTSSTTPLATGGTYTTPSISTTTTYYVENDVAGPTYHVGLANNSAGGGYLTSSQYLIFNVLKAGTLQSVYVYANGAGNRTFQLKNSGGTVLSTLTVNVPTGASRVTLNFPLVVGTGYQLGIPSTSTINLYRNTSGVAYPYADAGGYVSITSNTANDNTRYYFCYDWIVKGADCASSRTAVVATINPAMAATISSTNAGCGSNTGTAAINVTSGTPSYTYVWSNGGTASSISNLGAGTYTITVHDSHSCSATASTTVTSSGALSVTPSSNNINCFGALTGSASVVVSNGAQPYSYSWSNGANTPALANVAAGTYTITITDNTGCSATASQTLTQPTALNVSVTSNNASCGLLNGSASATANGGTSSYNYVWSSGSTTPSISNVAAGVYSLTVTDAHNCVTVSSANIGSTSPFNTTKSSANINCFGNTNGTASVTVSNGTLPYVYLWSNGGTTSSISNLTAGNYFVTVTDGSTCQHVDSFTITAPTALNAQVNPTNVLCNGNNSGSASASVSGGTANYTLHWFDNTNGNSVSNLSAGNYSVTVTDANNCTTVSNFIITEPSALSASSISTNALCFGAQNGTGTVTASGGTSAYSYLWCNGVTTPVAANLSSGSCTVTVTDANGCSTSSSVNISQPSQIQVVTSSANSTNSQSNGNASIDNITGGTWPYTYNWSNGGTTQTIFNLMAGTYAVTITDNNGCTLATNVVVQDVTGINSLSADNSISVYPNPAKEILTIESKQSFMTEIKLTDVLGQVVSQQISLRVNHVELNVSTLPAGVYILEVKQGDVKFQKQIVIGR